MANKKIDSQHKRKSKGSTRRIDSRKGGQTAAQARQFFNTIAQVVTRMRADGTSLRKASREFNIDPRTVVRLGGSALKKQNNGRYAAKHRDRILRVLVIPTSGGLREITLASSRNASELGKYWDSVQKYLETGDASGLRRFDGKFVTDSDGQRVPLLTDTEELDRLGSAGVLSFESVYAGVA